MFLYDFLQIFYHITFLSLISRDLSLWLGTWFSTFSGYITRIRGNLRYKDSRTWYGDKKPIQYEDGVILKPFVCVCNHDSSCLHVIWLPPASLTSWFQMVLLLNRVHFIRHHTVIVRMERILGWHRRALRRNIPNLFLPNAYSSPISCRESFHNDRFVCVRLSKIDVCFRDSATHVLSVFWGRGGRTGTTSPPW